MAKSDSAKDNARRELERLVNMFHREKSTYKQANYKEENISIIFLNPLFRDVLGWDIENRRDLPDSEKEVDYQSSMKVEGRSLRPDYLFSLQKEARFFLDAKAPKVNIEQEKDPAFQIRRYGWNKNLPVSVVSDFEEFAVYDCKYEPKSGQPAHFARVEYLTYDKYLDTVPFDFIYEHFHRDAVLRGSLESLTKTKRDKIVPVPVDRRFLETLETMRRDLAVALLRCNSNLGVAELNYLVQQLLDRIIFLRICESRNIEPKDKLFKITNLDNQNNYANLLKYFKEADKKYNSGLFDFKTDTLSTQIQLDDSGIQNLIHPLYPPFSYYEFSVLPVEIIGNAYEQFLGNEISIRGNRVQIEQKPEVRKAGGVYYTPQYIVKYIVKNTVGRLIETIAASTRKKPATIVEEIGQLKICDPSCGSGSFLLGAFQFLLDWHRDFYLKLKKSGKLDSAGFALPPLTPDGKLTTREKKRILNNNIYGVDLDERAVEISKLSLLLKTLEDETPETIAGELAFREKALPNLDMNIVCGNSLVGTDLKKTVPGLDKDALLRINPKDWQQLFPRVFRERGGFDAVIGNPPYGAIFGEPEKEYLRAHYKTFVWRGESYLVFIEKALELLQIGGEFGYIIPDTYLNLEFTRTTREVLLQKSIVREIVVLPSNVFADATVDTTILLASRAPDTDQFHPADVTIKIFPKKSVLPNLLEPARVFSQKTAVWGLGGHFNVESNPAELAVIQSVDARFPKLDDFVEMFYGIKAYQVGKGKPPQTEAIRDEKPFTSDTQKGKEWLPFFDGKHIGRYEISWKKNNWLNYGAWLAEPRKPTVFADEKILIRKIIGETLIATYVSETSFCNTLLFVLKLKREVILPYPYILGVLNSRFIGWYFRKKFQIAEDDTFPQIMIRDILQFAFPDQPPAAIRDSVVEHVREIMQLKKDLATTTLPRERQHLESQIGAAEGAIDRTVYVLYGLTVAEIGVIEKG